MALIKSTVKHDLETLEGKQAFTRERIVSANTSARNLLRTVIQSNRRLFWANPWGLTPQEVADAFGVDCATLFGLDVASTNLINSALAEEEAEMAYGAPEGYSITPGPDGSMRIEKEGQA